MLLSDCNITKCA